jgi:invasion protein IalB
MKTIWTLIRSAVGPALLVGMVWWPASATEADAETATFGDWTVRCIQREGLPPCDIVQSVRQRDSGRTIMQVSFVYAPAQERYAAQFVLPLGFLIQPGVLIRIDEKTELKDFPVTRCESQGCFVEKLVESKDLAPFRAGKAGVVIITAPGGRTLSFPVSFMGFTRAIDEMTARNKKASAGSQSPARR